VRPAEQLDRPLFLVLIFLTLGFIGFRNCAWALQTFVPKKKFLKSNAGPSEGSSDPGVRTPSAKVQRNPLFFGKE
jgi:hypothetical protein